MTAEELKALVGRKVRVRRDIEEPECGDHPRLVIAERGDTGAVDHVVAGEEWRPLGVSMDAGGIVWFAPEELEVLDVTEPERPLAQWMSRQKVGGLTERQRQARAACYEFREHNGKFPTARELAFLLGVTAGTADVLLVRLVAAGAIPGAKMPPEAAEWWPKVRAFCEMLMDAHGGTTSHWDSLAAQGDRMFGAEPPASPPYKSHNTGAA